MLLDEELENCHHLGNGHGVGPVHDDELVVFAVFDATEREGLNLASEAFKAKDLKRGEVSLARVRYTDLNCFLTDVVTPRSAALGAYLGVAPAVVSKLREVVYRLVDASPPIEGRAICVIPKVSPGDHEGHAALKYTASHQELSDPWKRKLRPIIAQDVADAFAQISAWPTSNSGVTTASAV